MPTQLHHRMAFAGADIKGPEAVDLEVIFDSIYLGLLLHTSILCRPGSTRGAMAFYRRFGVSIGRSIKTKTPCFANRGLEMVSRPYP